MIRFATAVLLGLLCAAVETPARTGLSHELLARVGQYVEEYYAQAQSILVEEAVVLQPLESNWSSAGFPRRLAYELRVEWDPGDGPGQGSATVVRSLLRAAGPPLGSSARPECFDPRPISPEPLEFLLPSRQHQFVFRSAGAARLDGRAVVRIDYEPADPRPTTPPRVEWEDDCGHVDLPGWLRGRIWVDAETAEIVRLDERLAGMIDIRGPEGRRHHLLPRWFTLERADTSIRYRPVTFADPDADLLLPSRIDSLTIVRNSGVPRLRTTRSFTNYRRFLTESRIVS